MRKDSSLARNFVLIFLALMAISIITVFPLFLSSELDNQNHTFLKEVSEKNAETIGFKFQEQLSHLKFISNSIDPTLLDNPKEAVRSVDITELHNDSYKRFGVASINGDAYTSDGISLSIANNEFVKKCAETGELVIRRMSAEESFDDEESLVMYSPLTQNGEIKAVFMLTFTVEQVMSNFNSTAFDSNEFFYIVDFDGNNIISNNPNERFRDIDNIFYGLPGNSQMNEEVIANIQEDMKSGDSDVIISTIMGDFYLYYAPLEFNDWYLFSLLPTSAVVQNRNAVLAYVGLMCFFLVMVFILFTVYAVSAEKRKKDELDKILYTDSLTGGSSYAKFCIDVKKQLLKTQRAAYIVMDLDNFKLVNDYYGYDMGNRTIKYINALWQEMLRDNEYVGRIAADRFAIYLRYSSEKDLMNRLENFCEKCKTFNGKNMSNYILVPSIGVYYIKEKTHDIQKMQNCAVMAKSLVKGDRDSMISVYNNKIKKDMTRKKLFHDELERAVKDEKLTVVLQPQFSTINKKISAAEMLIRWKKDDGTFVSPAEFIPVAEEKGLVKDIDRFVFKKACEIQQDLVKKGFESIDISVNVSQQSLYDINLVDTYLGILKETGANISHIHLEITETTLFDNNRIFVKRLQKIQKAGFKILLDDFGTGYSSLMLLKSMPINSLKLDKTFIDDYQNPRGQHIIECVVEMTKKIGITLVAEGVETAEQYEYIKNMGCDMVQGYYLSYPVDYDNFRHTIEENQQ